MYAHTLLAALLKQDGFRFMLHPDLVQDFPEGRPIQALDMERLHIHKDTQGVILARKRDTKFFLDPVTGSFQLNLSPAAAMSGTVQTGKFGPPSFLVRLLKGDEVYGFGAATGSLNKLGARFSLKTIDTNFYSIPGGSYSAFPFFMIRRGSECMGVFLNCSLPGEVEVDIEGSSRAEGPEVRFDIHTSVPIPIDVFVMNGSAARVLQAYARITGMPFLPPIWSLGFHQSRWSYRSQKRVIEVAERFRIEDIPCDAIHLDIHHMEAYKVFTWNKRNFPDPKAMHESLDKLGMRTVAIVDPGVAVEEEYDTYESGRNEDAFCRDAMGNYFKGKVWPGVTVFPDFTLENVRKWWAHQHAALFRMGVSGIWNDMNEPSWRLGKSTDPLLEEVKFKNNTQAEVRNMYANLEAEATQLAFTKFKPDERPFILTRSAFCGIQKYAGMWTGDNHSSWAQLRENLNMVLNLGLTGVPFSGADVGGFGSGTGLRAIVKWRKDPELFARWMEMGSLMPFFRAHTVLYSTDQEPWSFGEETLGICRKHIKRRYRLLHYIYKLFHESALTGAPIVRPVFYEFPNTKETDADGLFMLGPSILAAPVFERGAKDRTVVLPDCGEMWYDFETGETFAPGLYRIPTRPGTFPVFVRGGAAIPLAIPGRNAEDSAKTPLTIEIFPGAQIQGSFVLDAGNGLDGRQAKVNVDGKRDRTGTLQLSLSIKEDGFTPFQRTVRLRLPRGYRTGSIAKGKKLEAESFDMVQEDRLGTAMQFEIPLEDQKLEFEYRTP
ncbi:MAG: alpha-glucosidase [Spirochaetia bacterium]|nr:alpha-glucosidase [Spirochaetia bacterium]